jgi:eukaryotic-like serine/threonine-protein kinase
VVERFGSCRVVEELGSGALATVYKAIQEPLGRVVAVKALKSTIATTSPFAAHLEREARVLGELGHPNIIFLFDFVRTDVQMYLVLEYVDGPSLAELLAKKKTLRPEMVAAVGAEAARGLEHAHARGVVHRDVKPANILLSKTGEVKLVDFGIAQRERMPSFDEPLAQRDTAAFGTPAYMSPEQILGEFVDARSDLFSLGVVLYQMLTGARPFDGDDPNDRRAAAQRIRRDPPKPMRSRGADVPRTLDRIVMRSLEKLPVDRFTSAAALAEELDEFVRGEWRGPPHALVLRALKEAGLTKIATPFGTVTDATAAETRTLRPTLIGFSALFGILAIGGTAIQLSSHEGGAGSSPAGSHLELVPTGAASLRIVVTPWAEVSIDGHSVDTTPFARSIPLSPGTHYVKLVHPDAEPETRVVVLAPGDTAHLEVAMRMKGAPDAQALAAQPSPRPSESASAPDSGLP